MTDVFSPATAQMPLLPEHTNESCNVSPKSVYRRSSMALNSSISSRLNGQKTPHLKRGMSVTEQIARQTRKSTVLDPKNALLIMAIPDYDDYKIMQPYSCRSLSTKSKFVGGRDFITRHNPQETSDFKMQYSRDIGNLNRHRSILAPPTSDLRMFASCSTSVNHQTSSTENDSITNNDKCGSLWRKTFTSTMKTCWILTHYGIETLIGPEYRLTTRVSVPQTLSLTRPPKPPILPVSHRLPVLATRPEKPSLLSVFSTRESARKGMGADLADEKTMTALSQLTVGTPSYRFVNPKSAKNDRQSHGSTSVNSMDGAEVLSLAPYADISWEKCDVFDQNQEVQEQLKTVGCPRFTTSPNTLEQGLPATSHRFVMEVSPPSLALGTLQSGQVYLVPVRVRNVGTRQERFRVNRVAAACAGLEASIAEASYQRETARLAPGLAAIITVALSFHHPGLATGSLYVEAEGLGTLSIDIKCIVR